MRQAKWLKLGEVLEQTLSLAPSVYGWSKLNTNLFARRRKGFTFRTLRNRPRANWNSELGAKTTKLAFRHGQCSLMSLHY